MNKSEVVGINLSEDISKEDPKNDEEEISKDKATEEQKFINLQRIDLHRLVNIFDSYATKKTYATGFFNLALIATNFTQLKQLIDLGSTEKLGVIDIVLLMFVSISLLLQV
jgi:hypothetical protein